MIALTSYVWWLPAPGLRRRRLNGAWTGYRRVQRKTSLVPGKPLSFSPSRPEPQLSWERLLRGSQPAPVAGYEMAVSHRPYSIGRGLPAKRALHRRGDDAPIGAKAPSERFGGFISAGRAAPKVK
jgi:hypothetical protein